MFREFPSTFKVDILHSWESFTSWVFHSFYSSMSKPRHETEHSIENLQRLEPRCSNADDSKGNMNRRYNNTQKDEALCWDARPRLALGTSASLFHMHWLLTQGKWFNLLSGSSATNWSWQFFPGSLWGLQLMGGRGVSDKWQLQHVTICLDTDENPTVSQCLRVWTMVKNS